MNGIPSYVANAGSCWNMLIKDWKSARLMKISRHAANARSIAIDLP